MPDGIENGVFIGKKINAGVGTKRFKTRIDGTIQPVQLTDSEAENDSIYYSTTQSKLVYKDSGGTVNNLY